MINLKNNIPTTISEAVDLLFNSLDKKEIDFIKNSSADSLHFSTGMAIRNNWGLWQKSSLRKDVIEKYYIAHADDISSLILDWVYAKVQGKEFNPLEHCKEYHEHWKQFGKTSLEAGEILE